MNAVTKIIFLFALFTTAHSGLWGSCFCLAACHAGWAGCVAGTGGMAWASPAEAARVPEALKACSVGYAACVAACGL